MPHFKYSPLQSLTSIRLLILRNAPALSSFALEEVDLENNPKYEALSYTWQDPDAGASKSGQETSIQIDKSGALIVTTNLSTILQHVLELMPDVASERRIWIDQICINQTDVEERNKQVSIMHRIYGQAHQTLIWLGGPNRHTPVLLDLLHRFANPPFDYGSSPTTTVLDGLEKRLKNIFHEGEWIIFRDAFYFSSCYY